MNNSKLIQVMLIDNLDWMENRPVTNLVIDIHMATLTDFLESQVTCD